MKRVLIAALTLAASIAHAFPTNTTTATLTTTNVSDYSDFDWKWSAMDAQMLDITFDRSLAGGNTLAFRLARQKTGDTDLEVAGFAIATSNAAVAFSGTNLPSTGRYFAEFMLYPTNSLTTYRSLSKGKVSIINTLFAATNSQESGVVVVAPLYPSSGVVEESDPVAMAEIEANRETWEQGATGSVSSVFGRTGDVEAESGDYAAHYAPLSHEHDATAITNPPWLEDFSTLTPTDIEAAGGVTNASGESDHAALTSLAWIGSGHTGTAGRVAIFAEGGAAGEAGFGAGAYLDGDDNIAVSNDIIEGAAAGKTALQPAATNGAEWGSHADLYPASNPSGYIASVTLQQAVEAGADAAVTNVPDLTMGSGKRIDGQMFGQAAGNGASGGLWHASGYTAGQAAEGDFWGAFGHAAGVGAIGNNWGAFGFFTSKDAINTNSHAFGNRAGWAARGDNRMYLDVYSADPNYEADGPTNDTIFMDSDGVLYLGGGAARAENPSAGGVLRGSWSVTTNQFPGIPWSELGGGISAPTATGIAEVVVGAYTGSIATAWQNPDSATDWLWSSDGTQITLTNYSGPNDVVVPDMLDGLPVRVIGNGTATIFPASITSVSGGENLIVVDMFAFYGRTSLLSVDLPTVKWIRSSAFSGCTALVDVSIPSVTNVGGFINCGSLPSIELPNAKIVEGAAFENCGSLESVFMGQDAPATNADVFTSASETLIVYVTSPTATGWGANWNGRPVVRMPAYAAAVTLGGVERSTWPTGEGGSATNATLLTYDGSNMVGEAALDTNHFLVEDGTLKVNTNALPAGPTGPQGEQGEQGPQGIPGTNGVDGADGVDAPTVTNIAAAVAFGARPTYTLASAATVTIPRLTGTNAFILACTNPTVTLAVATGSWAVAELDFYTLSVNRGTNTLAFTTGHITNSTVLDIPASTDKTLMFLKPYNSFVHRVRE